MISMGFAGFTAVIAKQGLVGISGELGITVRTCFVALFILLYAVFAVSREEISHLTPTNYWWLGLSALTTAISWIFYFKAIKLGDVSTVALIDKGSFVVAVLMAWLILGEKITPRVLLGSVLILAGLLVVSRK